MENINKNIQEYLQEKGYSKINLKAVFFDMDGVLFDSMKGHSLAWYNTFQDMDIPVTKEEFYLYEGATSSWTIELIFKKYLEKIPTEKEIKEIYQEKINYFNDMPLAFPMPGAKEVIEQVKALGLKIVLVTGSGQPSLLERLDEVYPDTFNTDNMITAEDVNKGKPNPEPYLCALRKAGVEASEAIVIENAPLGVQAATGAEIFTIAVNTGPLEDKSLCEAGANLILKDMEDLNHNFQHIYQSLLTVHR